MSIANKEQQSNPKDDLVTFLLEQVNLLTKEREDYKAKYSEALSSFKEVMIERNGLAASRYAYATEFPLDEEYLPDIGSIHQNIRALKSDHAKVMKAAKLALDSSLKVYATCDWYGDDGKEAMSALSDTITALRQVGVK